MVKQVKQVIFEIGEGSFERGFPVKVRIGETGKPHTAEISGRLPPAPEFPTIYTTWQSIYEKLPANWLIIIPKNQITNFSSKDACNQAAQAFQDSFNTWLNQAPVLEIERQLSRQIGNSEDVRFILQTQDSLLRRLPWHLWGFFSTSHPQAEIVISSEYEPSTKQLKAPVKVLAILGSNQEINLEQDLYFLKNLPGAKVKALIEPTRRQLIENLRTQPWDILFFAGHSMSKEGDSWGEIQINADESYLSLRNLRYSLRHAVRQGLKLAIFNSKANQGRLRLFASTSLYTLQTLQQGKGDINGLVLAVPWEARRNFASEFAKNSQKLWNSLVTWRSATSYDATIAIVNGLQQSKTRDGLQKVLRNPKFSANGVTGKIQFLQSGDRPIKNKNDMVLVKIQPSRTFANQYEFFPLYP
ncbi:ABC transporter substrate-binding protein [Fischerella sp. NIES-3754]|uniref:ABC transporter substrate-binding protein n=1 Tax=Fischerella sp. NIES-3754 TaxID=1752063 RepID=UPI000722DD01|nr:ABC transporter substrate-binding protein [Fischerella sp. NIES-3754]BAU05332.1 hypothetical protein FIS3754_12270 [Fischerella sp. NIES-3754]